MVTNVVALTRSPTRTPPASAEPASSSSSTPSISGAKGGGDGRARWWRLNRPGGGDGGGVMIDKSVAIAAPKRHLHMTCIAVTGWKRTLHTVH